MTESYEKLKQQKEQIIAKESAKSTEREQKLYDALKRIAMYDSPEKLKKRAEKDYGLEGDEVIEMAYENVLIEAKSAIKGMRRPK